MHNIISEMKTNRRRTRSSEFSACLLYQSQRMKISIAERSRDYFWWCLREHHQANLVILIIWPLIIC